MTTREATKQLKKLAKGSYCTMQKKDTFFPIGKVEHEYSVYIDNSKWYTAKTWEIAFGLLEDDMGV